MIDYRQLLAEKERRLRKADWWLLGMMLFMLGASVAAVAMGLDSEAFTWRWLLAGSCVCYLVGTIKVMLA